MPVAFTILKRYGDSVTDCTMIKNKTFPKLFTDFSKFLCLIITYKDEAGKKKHKWIATGLKERGNRKAAKEILDKALA